MPSQFNILCQETSLYNVWNIVKEKGAMGGIDGVTIQEFEKDKRRQIARLAEELTNKTWKSYPYLEIEVASVHVYRGFVQFLPVLRVNDAAMP